VSDVTSRQARNGAEPAARPDAAAGPLGEEAAWACSQRSWKASGPTSPNGRRQCPWRRSRRRPPPPRRRATPWPPCAPTESAWSRRSSGPARPRARSRRSPTRPRWPV